MSKCQPQSLNIWKGTGVSSSLCGRARFVPQGSLIPVVKDDGCGRRDNSPVGGQCSQAPAPYRHWEVYLGYLGHVLYSFGCCFLPDHGEDSARRLMQSVPEKQRCGQTMLWLQCFPKQILYCKYSQGVNQPLWPQQRGALLSFLPLLNTFTCWHSAAWGLLELEVACTLHLNKSCFHDYFLMPF